MDDNQVCKVCGVPVAESKSRGWVHTAELPKGSQAHDAEPVDKALWEAAKGYDAMEVAIAEARAYAERFREQMKREEMNGVQWSDHARHTVVLLQALEAAEEVAVKAVEEATMWKQKYAEVVPSA